MAKKIQTPKTTPQVKPSKRSVPGTSKPVKAMEIPPKTKTGSGKKK